MSSRPAVNVQVVEYTVQKLDAAIETIRELRRGEFPQHDSQNALTAIETLFDSLRKDLLTIRPEDDAAAVATLCNAVLGQLFRYLPVIGFLHRSRNPGNPFELYGPLRRLALAVISSDARVILSSEWDFSPYTLLQMPELPKFVLIGLPATESGNALLAPLAGHEMGHSIWALERAENIYQQVVFEGIVSAVRMRWAALRGLIAGHLTDDAKVASDLVARQRLVPAVKWALRQCEEVFCDLVGLRLFGEAYLHAFAYLLAPGLSTDPSERIRDYPTAWQRVQYLVNAAGVYGIPVPADFQQMFEKDPTTSGAPTDLLSLLQELSDEATRGQVDAITRHVKQYADNHNAPPIHNSAVDTALRHLGLMVPAESPRIAEILIAGWKAAKDESLWPGIDKARRRLILSELVLKSAEVLEFQTLKEATPAT
jgi:hypothetical protein